MKKFFSNTIVQTILIIISNYVFSYGGALLGMPVLLISVITSNSAVSFATHYASFIGIWILVFAFWWFVKKFRYMFKMLGPEMKGNRVGTSLGLGLVFGLGFNLVLGMLAIANGDIRLYFSEFNVWYILMFIVCVGIQSGAEELVSRAWIFAQLRRVFPKYPIIAVAVNAFLFAIMHCGNEGFTIWAFLSLFLSGIMFSFMIHYFDSFWGCVIAHTGWNFCQSILLGLPNSGIVSVYSVFKLDAANARNSFFYDTAFGIEGTAAAIILLSIGMIILWIVGSRKKQEKLTDLFCLKDMSN